MAWGCSIEELSMKWGGRLMNEKIRNIRRVGTKKGDDAQRGSEEWSQR